MAWLHGNNAVHQFSIFSLLCLWYFGSRKTEIDIANGSVIISRRKLLNFFGADTNKAQWPDCSDAHKTLYKGFDTNAFYGKDHDKMSDQRKDKLVRERFSAVLAAGLPETYHQLLAKQTSDEDDLDPQ